MWRRVLRWLQHPVVRIALLAIAGSWIVREFAGQWEEVRQSARSIDVQWPWVLLASAIVVGVYAMLIQSWRMLLAGWGGHLAYRDAVRIWTIANLGRWIPGKLWSVGALSMLASETGVSGVAAAGAALLGTLLNLGAGFGIMALTGAGGLDVIHPLLRTTAATVGVMFIVGVLLLPRFLPPLLTRFATWRGLPAPPAQLPARTLWLAVTINAASWVGYGIAFACFSRAVSPAVSGNPALFIAVFSASYLVGYLFLISPGGLGVREVVLVGLLTAIGAADSGDAAILSVTSRVWLTVLEVLPGLISLMVAPARRARLPESG